ncbi:hypothetical protein [Streptomyces sp. SAI-129]|uniref:hypothetical protein n=1 Tax=Streptomyces sp. SAI-129 TaxID=3377727 RepID=UPI003C7C3D05
MQIGYKDGEPLGKREGHTLRINRLVKISSSLGAAAGMLLLSGSPSAAEDPVYIRIWGPYYGGPDYAKYEGLPPNQTLKPGKFEFFLSCAGKDDTAGHPVPWLESFEIERRESMSGDDLQFDAQFLKDSVASGIKVTVTNDSTTERPYPSIGVAITCSNRERLHEDVLAVVKKRVELSPGQSATIVRDCPGGFNTYVETIESPAISNIWATRFAEVTYVNGRDRVSDSYNNPVSTNNPDLPNYINTLMKCRKANNPS